MSNRIAFFAILLAPLPAYACFGAGVAGTEPGQFLMTVLLGALGLSLVLIPVCTILLGLKGLVYRRILKNPVFRDLARAHLRIFAILLSAAAVFYALDQRLHVPLTLSPGGMPALAGNDDARSALGLGLFLLFFFAPYFLECKLLRKPEGAPKRLGVALAVLNLLSALVLWFAVSAYSLASCGTISAVPLPKTEVPAK